MVREIVHVQVGQCGNQIGNAFWDTMGAEHRLEANGKFKGKPDEGDNQKRLDKMDVYYQETGTMRKAPSSSTKRWTSSAERPRLVTARRDSS